MSTLAAPALSSPVPTAAVVAGILPRMLVHEVAETASVSGLEREIAAAVAAAPPDAVLQLRVSEALAGAEALRAARLRALGPPTANVSVSVRLSRPSRRPLLGAGLFDA